MFSCNNNISSFQIKVVNVQYLLTNQVKLPWDLKHRLFKPARIFQWPRKILVGHVDLRLRFLFNLNF